MLRECIPKIAIVTGIVNSKLLTYFYYIIKSKTPSEGLKEFTYKFDEVNFISTNSAQSNYCHEPVLPLSAD